MTVANNNPPPVANNPPPVNHPVAAVVDTRPKVDVNATLREAEAARRKGDDSKAMGLYQKVLSADSSNAQARNGIADLKKEAEASNKTIVAGSEADFMLAKGILGITAMHAGLALRSLPRPRRTARSRRRRRPSPPSRPRSSRSTRCSAI